MGREDKKEPISDLTTHNLKREEEVRAATKRLDEYLVTKYDLNKPKSAREGSEEKNKENSKTSEAKEGDQTEKKAKDKNDKKAEEKESETKVTEK